ncbi:MAG: ATP-dependent DNA helicase [Candidatus Omnitrophica bacterium]|nr:ATP-dependent DNA helicase [Candidatus Omnitrophota bacterium]
MNIFSLVFGKDKEDLIRKIRGFESRPQQIHIVKAVQHALSTKRHLIVEAGTGVGKSLAYLLPFIKWVVTNNTKVVISTYTKTLQEQLVKKDLPNLKKLLGLDFKFVLCLGSRNYLCLRRLNQDNNYDLFESKQEREEIERIHEWRKTTRTGLRLDMEFAVKESVWNKVDRESDLCLGKKCIFRKECFYSKARTEQYKAHILITNHHLFFSHLASEGNILPSFGAVVFDEAHTLEDVATSYLGIEMSNFQIKYFFDSLFNPQSKRGFLRRIDGVPRRAIEEARKKVEESRNAARTFFSELALKFGEESKTTRIREKQLVVNYLKEPLSRLISMLKDILEYAKDDGDKIEIDFFISRAYEINSILDTILYMREERYVYWIEILNRQRAVKYTLYAAPIDISLEFRKRVLDRIKPVILTSATLSTKGNFEFIKTNLGMEEDTDELLLDSPFNYEGNALLYLAGNLPDPSLEFELYQEKAIGEIKNIVSFMKGRTFVLFTSFRMMDRAYKELKEHLRDLRILRQGDAPRYKLIEMFKHNKGTVLLGTNTFWQGIDVPGRALECVIISKLPFSVPDEPIVEAKMEELTFQNKNPFIYYQMPRAIIMFKQGFGRLIRTQKDKGMVVILDPRIKTKTYGRDFLKVLPRCRRVYDLDSAAEFLV